MKKWFLMIGIIVAAAAVGVVMAQTVDCPPGTIDCDPNGTVDPNTPGDSNCPTGGIDGDPNCPADPNTPDGECPGGGTDCDPNQPDDPNTPDGECPGGGIDCDPNQPEDPNTPDDPDPSTCNCTNIPNSICGRLGYRISLVDFGINQELGTSFWDYTVCNVSNTDASCVPAGPLEHFDIGNETLGDCLTTEQEVTISQTDGFSAMRLTCSVGFGDPMCGYTGVQGREFIGLCQRVETDTLDAGECVRVRLGIAGEQPTLGPGRAYAVTNAPIDCNKLCMLGPSCSSCEPPPPDDNECLTRTIGFWGTHPHITALYLPVEACGYTLDQVEAGACDSATEGLCVSPGKEARKNQAYASFVRQLIAAKLNIAASSTAFDGDCGEEIVTRINQCEALCGADKATISASGCIEDLTAFNESFDSVGLTIAPFDNPGPANPTECQQANGNGIVVGYGACK